MSTIARAIPFVVLSLAALLAAAPAGAQSAGQPTAEELARQIQELKRDYETRIRALESQLSNLAKKSAAAPPARRAKSDNAFNPAIGIVLNGMLADYSAAEAEIPGFQLGHEGERAPEGFSVGHSEITASGSIDDKFFGGLTLGVGSLPGEAAEVELEEAYVQTLPGAGLPDGMRIKAGRALWTFGYLNELHAHGDDFADRPLPYRVFLDNAYNDDGVEASLVLPTGFYSEIGGGVFRGGDTPFGGSENGIDAWSAHLRVGGDLGRSGAWRIGGYTLGGKSQNRGGGGHGHGEEEEAGHAEDEEEGDHAEDEEEEEHGHDAFFSEGLFTGDTQLYAVDFRATFAPTGNAREGELILQGEYFWRQEDGTYTLAEEEEEEAGRFDTTTRGWYLQAVYRFGPRWRAGFRYSQLNPPEEAELDHDPAAFAAMVDWTNSEFGRLRLQYNRETLAKDRHDNQFLLQYTMSLGAHGAHSF